MSCNRIIGNADFFNLNSSLNLRSPRTTLLIAHRTCAIRNKTREKSTSIYIHIAYMFILFLLSSVESKDTILPWKEGSWAYHIEEPAYRRNKRRAQRRKNRKWPRIKPQIFTVAPFCRATRFSKLATAIPPLFINTDSHYSLRSFVRKSRGGERSWPTARTPPSPSSTNCSFPTAAPLARY